MPATIQIHEMSALAAGADKTSGTIRFKDADNAVVDTSNPLVIPAEGSIYSYTKKLRAYMAVVPDTDVRNFRWYTDGGSGFGPGVGATVKNLGITWEANYKTAQVGGVDLFSKTSGSPLQGDLADAGPFLPAKLDSYIGDLIELQMSVSASVTHGALAPESLTLAYDEI